MRELLRAFIKKELRQMFRDPRMKFLLFVMPIVQMTIFGLALDMDAKNIELFAKPMANDRMLRDITRDALGSGWFVPGPDDEKQGGEQIEHFISGRLETALYPPEGGVTKAYERGEGRLQAVIDGADLTRGRAIQTYLANIVGRVAAERAKKTNTEPAATQSQVKESSVPKKPIEFVTRILYNPELVTSYNLVPGVLVMLISIITVMLTSMSIAKEKEIGTFETLIAAPVTVSEVLLGKTIPYVVIGCANLPLVFFVAVVGFDVPMRGSYLWLGVATLFFVVSTVSVGTMISIVARNQQQAMMGSFIFLMPAILLAGIMFPVDNLPLIPKAVAFLNPLMYFTILLRNIMLKGGDPMVLMTHTGALFLIAVVSVSTAFKRFRMHLG